MPQILKMILVLATIVSVAGCAMSRKTTTEITAIEQALMSRSALDSLEAAAVDPGEQSFTLSDAELVSAHKEVVLNATRQHLLQAGYRYVDEDGDITVYPRANYSGIDDGDFFIGFPSVPVPVPGVGTATTPELALFKKASQRGRNQLEFYGINSEDGSLAFSSRGAAAERGYTRWTILLAISFRTTNLDEPF